MPRKTRFDSHASRERWLVSYADFITLLFAFFVVLYAVSEVDKRKASAMSVAMGQAFQTFGPDKNQANGDRRQTPESTPSGFVNTKLELDQVTGRQLTQIPHASRTLSQLKTELETALKSEIQRRELAIRSSSDGLVISLREFGFFDSGSANLRADAAPAFTRLATILAENEFELRIEGHTDDVPIHNPRYQSNWELSTARATETVRLLLTEFDVDPGRVSAAGYAEFHPVSGNETTRGRAVNRRVDIVVLAPKR